MKNKISEYFATKALSNSALGLMWNPRWVKLKQENPDLEDDDKKYFRIGAALDCLLTSPERWEDDFEVVDAVKPYGLMGKFIDNLPSGLVRDSELDLYQEAYDKSGYKMKLEKVVEKFWENEEARAYYILTRDINEDKVILSRDEYDSVIKSKDLIMANQFLYGYFFTTNIYTELMHQVPIYFKYKDEDCKALLDGILINHKDKTIQPFDLKTTGKSVYEFPQSYLQFGYYRQCAFYELALKTEESPIKVFLDKGYKLLDFIFIVVESKVSSSHPAIIYKTNEFDRQCGITGGYRNRKLYKGIDQLIDEYKFHRDNDYWDLPKDLLDTRGMINLEIFDAEKSIVYTSDDEVSS